METANTPERKKVIFSAIQPSGTITLGNYVGALRNWVGLQDDYDCIFALADLHTITVRQDPAKFRKNALEAYALLLACGIDLDKSLFFIQSHVHTHAELAWLLNCYTQFGELSRMTQFKDKSQKHADNVNVGLFAYPSLMAADILAYQADMVPVGLDQKQHLELTRNIAERFNGIYGQTFKVPDPYIPKVGAKIMSLQDPTRKMSKSDENVNSYVACRISRTTLCGSSSGPSPTATLSAASDSTRENKPGVSNLMSIYSAVTGRSFEAIEAEFDGKGYGAFKPVVGEAVVEMLRPIQEETRRLLSDKAYLEGVYLPHSLVGMMVQNTAASEGGEKDLRESLTEVRIAGAGPSRGCLGLFPT